MGRRDVRPLLFLLAVLLVHFSPILLTGRTFFLGDLTYFNHPWRELPAELLERGEFPLWNPYAYMGMPLLGALQPGTFSPGNLFFLFFPFAAAYKLQLLFFHALAAFFAYLWTRRWGGRGAAAAAAAVLSIGGFLAARVGLVIVTATLPWWPAFFLFAGNAGLLALAMACALLGGHPPTWAGLWAGALAAPWIWGRRGAWKVWAAGTVLALGLCACALFPGIETILHSNRSAGTAIESRLMESLAPKDLADFVSPVFIDESDPSGAKHPLWASFYLGFAACALAVLGFLRLDRRRKAWVACFAAAATLVLLGGESRLSLWLWEKLPPLHYVRFPKNFAFLPLAAALPLIALGLRGRRWAGAACLCVCAELLLCGRGLQPTLPDAYFTEAGPLVRRLQADLGGHRYAFSPQAALLLRGKGKTTEDQYFDVKRRLYASTNVPFHLEAATSLGESMLLDGTFRVMDFLFTRKDAAEARRYLPWADAKVLLTKNPRPELGPPSANDLWWIYETRAPARARWVPDSEAGKLAGGFEGAVGIAGSRTLRYEQIREDSFRVDGTVPGPGAVLIANPIYPGWQVYLNGGEAEAAPALTAFQMVRVGPGPVRLDFVYRPSSFLLGALLTLATLAALAGWAFLKRPI